MQESIAEDSFGKIAADLGMNASKFDECLDTEKYKSEVESDTLMGIHAGVAGTPTFFINEQKIAGPKPFKTFRNIIDEELEK